MWYLSKIALSNAIYSFPYVFEFERAVSVESLQQMVERLLGWQWALRASFREEEGELRMVDAVDVGGVLRIIRSNSEVIGPRFLEACWQPFRLDVEPLFRAVAEEGPHGIRRVAVVFHHLILDAGAVNSLFRVLGEGEVSPIYAEQFALAHAQQEVREKERSDLDYWCQHLKGMPQILRVPTQVPRRAERSFGGIGVATVVSKDTQGSVARFSVISKLSVPVIYCTVFQTLLMRLAGDSDFGIAVPVSLRSRLHSDLATPMINTVIVRASAHPDWSFGEAAKRTAASLFSARKRGHVPLQRVVSALGVSGGSSEPLAQASFNYTDQRESVLGVDGQIGRRIHLEPKFAIFDLALDLIDGVEGLVCKFSARQDLFSKEFVEQAAHLFERLAYEFTQEPERLLSAPMRSPPYVTRIREWNSTYVDYPTNSCVPDLIEKQVERTPMASALVFKDRRLTYRELNDLANALASQLRRVGVGADSLVGLCVDRSFEMVIGMLAILKAGGAYLPLDPAYPEDRLRFMVSDSGARWVLIQRRYEAKVRGDGVQIIAIDDCTERKVQNPSRTLTPANLVYCIYTSGSTGQPKGSLNLHRGVVNLLQWYWSGELAPIKEEKVVLASSLSFDLTQKNILGTLAYGATLVIPLGNELDVESFRETCLQYRPTRINCTPSAFKLYFPEGPLDSLRHVILGGEAIDDELARAVTSGGATLVNSYGPTECSDVSIWYAARDGLELPSPLPIGKPIPNVQVHILDGSMQPVPISAMGDIWIGGVGVGRGYLNRDELNAEKFRADPEAAAERIYKTGDLGRYRFDGQIEFLGRVDHQVKIRGFRIELGEIENALLQLTGVRETAVLVRSGVGGNYLVAYISGPAALDRSALRAQLQGFLPEHMVPSAFILLEALPLNPNGKVDRGALAALEPVTAQADDYVAPRTEIEDKIAGVWKEILQVERVGLYDNFFSLGGHSLLAMQVISALKRVSLEVSLHDFFQNPTVARLASVCRNRSMGQEPTNLGRRSTYPLTPAQERLWFLEQYEPGTGLYNITVAWSFADPIDSARLERAIAKVVQRHDSLRTTFSQDSGISRQQVQSDVLTKVRRQESDDDVEILVAADLHTPFKFDSESLCRFRIVERQGHARALIATFHHIVADGRSVAIFAQELSAAYNQCLPDVIPPQFGEFVLSGGHVTERAEADLRFWTSYLEGAPKVLELPTQNPKPALLRLCGDSIPLHLDRQAFDRLKVTARSGQTTVFCILAAALAHVLHRYSQQDEVCIGYPATSRPDARGEQVIGFFVNTHVLRIKADRAVSWMELSRRILADLSKITAHSNIPFERLVEALLRERELGHSPLFQVLLSLNSFAGRDLQLGPVRGEWLEVKQAYAKFELAFDFTESESGLHGQLVYNTDLYSADFARAIGDMLLEVLDEISRKPDQTLQNLPIPRSDALSITRWNLTQRANSAAACVHELIEAQVARTPDATAIVFEGQSVSYRDLNERANALAWTLDEFGVGPDSLVGLCADRSIEMVVGMLAILKAGGAYVPLDPSYPDERLGFMVSDSGARWVLVRRQYKTKVSTGVVQSIDLDAPYGRRVEGPSRTTVLDNLVYCIYTSGSTGEPKGSLNLHRGVVNLLHWYWSGDLAPIPGEKVVLASSLSFDLTQKNILGTLAYGATLVIPPGNELDVESFRDICQRYRPTRINCTPSAFKLYFPVKPLDSLRHVVLGGESVDDELARMITDGGATLINLYGPTECSDVSVWFAAGRSQLCSPVPIGKPIPNVQVHILDAHMQPVPVMATGEIWIGGIGVGRGYLNRDELTRESFRPHPQDPTKFIYKTGDLGRYRFDGQIDFRGRADHQVKLRGFRIELGEVENALLRVKGVHEAAVLTRRGDIGEHLVAYLSGPDALDRDTLRAQLQRFLPEYMVPAAYVLLDNLPLSPNGKIDRGALARIEPSAVKAHDFVAPRTELEKRIAGVWKEILQAEQVGIRDNFFSLGGHSLLAARVASRTTELGVRLRDVFMYPTIESLALQLEERGAIETTPITRRSRMRLQETQP